MARTVKKVSMNETFCSDPFGNIQTIHYPMIVTDIEDMPYLF